MELKESIDCSKYQIGCIIGRFQLDELHEGHLGLIEFVRKKHTKVIIFLGIPVIPNTKTNPLDFASRKAMIQNKFPDIVILPLKDQRDDKLWANNLDIAIKLPFGDLPALLYGSRDSFLSHYKGGYQTAEVTTTIEHSGTLIRDRISQHIIPTSDFRAGVIYATYAQRPVTYSTVDVAAYNEKHQLLLARKPNERLFRFVGGFVDREDKSYEIAAKREFKEEANNSEIADLQYITSIAVDDWRYKKLESGIMTTLFLGKFVFGSLQATDDIAELKWVDIYELLKHFEANDLSKIIMLEHIDLMKILLGKITLGKVDGFKDLKLKVSYL